MKSYFIGLLGEGKSLNYLKKQGLKPVASRVRLGRGEIDLVMRQGDCTVFVEVKYRPKGQAGDGLEAVTHDKRRRMMQAAALYLEQNGLWNTPARFDVLEITAQGICYLPNAFDFE